MPNITICQHRGKLCLRYRINGKPRYRVVQDPTNVEQERIALAAELLAGGSNKLKELQKSLSEHIDDFHADLLAATSEKHAGMIRRRVERVFEAAGTKRVSDIRVAKTRVAISKLRCSPRKRKKKPQDYPLLSERSRHHHARAAKQFTRWLVRERRITEDPLAEFRLKKVSIERNPRDRLQPDELRLLIRTTDHSRMEVEGYPGLLRAWVYRLAVMTGLRRGELASLAPESFSLKTRTVTVEAAYTKDGEKAVLPLNKGLSSDLEEWLEDKPRDAPLFPGLAEKRTSKMMKRDLEAAGIPPRTSNGTRCFHALRNTYISGLFDRGCDIALAQKLARHSDVRLTAGYARQTREAEQKAIDDLDYPG